MKNKQLAHVVRGSRVNPEGAVIIFDEDATITYKVASYNFTPEGDLILNINLAGAEEI